MEQESRFELDLGRLALLKKKFLAHYEQFFMQFFSSFHGQKLAVLVIIVKCVCLRLLSLLFLDSTRSNFLVCSLA